MMKRKYSTFTEVRALEENAFAMGIPIIKLMENAGKAVYEEIINIPQAKKNSILIVAGYGNNGGDGLVTARLLVNEGYNCTLALIGDKNKFNSLSSQKNFERLIEILTDDNIIRIKDEKAFGKFKNNIKDNELIIDALLGIGISGTPKEPYKSVIEYLNSHFRGKIISIDTPSGYNPTSNNTIFISNPEKIVCLGKNKVESNDFSKSLIIVKDIGIPEEAETYVGLGDLKWNYPKRKKDSHKRDNGVVTIIGGSDDYIGAPALAGFGAFRTGADLVFILTPKNIRHVLAAYSPDFITIPAKENEIDPLDISLIIEEDKTRNSTFIIGPGMKDSVKTNQSVNKLLDGEMKRQIVIDAGALSALSESELQLLSIHDTILTPHRGEFGKVFNKKFHNDLRKDASLVAEIALKYKTVILVKGQTDIISDGFRTKFNKTGHPGMTVGGSGDVLTGIIGSLFSVTNDAYTSACLGAYISGAAGELASQQFGNGLMASDITNNINKVIAKALSFKPKEK